MQKQRVLDPQKFLSASLPPDLILAPMRIQDLDEVMRIEALSFSNPWSRQQFVDEIERNPLSTPTVLKKSGREQEVAGYCVCWVVAGELHINNIAINPQDRGQGNGEILMQWALDFGRMSGCRRAVLEVRVTNEKAIRLYQRLGFETLGVAPSYYEDTGEDAYIFVKNLKA